MATEKSTDLEVRTSSNDIKIAEKFDLGLTPQEVAIIKGNLCKTLNDLEFAYYLNVCKALGYNPLLKEVWAYKDTKGNLLIFIGRDGLLNKALKRPDFVGMKSFEVCENDDFSSDTANTKVSHNIKSLSAAKRGKVIGAYALLTKTSGEKWLSVVDITQFSKAGGSNKNSWDTNPAAMIRKVAEVDVLKRAYGTDGLAVDTEFNIVNDRAVPVDMQIADGKTEQDLEMEALTQTVIDLLEFNPDRAQEIREMLAEKQMSNELDAKFLRNVITDLGGNPDA